MANGNQGPRAGGKGTGHTGRVSQGQWRGRTRAAPQGNKKEFHWHQCEKVVPRGAFWQIKLYFEPEKRPAGPIWVDQIVFSAGKSSRTGPLTT